MARPKKAVAAPKPKLSKTKAPAVSNETTFTPKMYHLGVVADKMAAAQAYNEAMVGRAVDVPLEEQVRNLRKERERFRDRAEAAENLLRRERTYHELRASEIEALLVTLNDLRYA